ncbi:ABC transporter ATP-binding protein [Cohnella thailandensis]|uniref:ABC transporter ATP-binding protein n=1 Tax=Cohnella thailandensis TaxID=557557 RepID=A0A841SYW6_9BACL|nr:ABC transporter ATP-binding protein [Cohnella thailandensis]MBB6633961.1 ABC transporter ATP-binding protein [Cohnella thailandensis]MBP1972644.1 putative ABC transport system ATP-binding protein [Cohnella thailandensis]
MSNIEQAPLIRLENIYKQYTLAGETFNALDGINLTVNYGDFLAIIGPSGSGKSTLMNVLGCLDQPSSGKYFLDGKEVEELSERKLATIRNTKIGFIFQSFHLLPKLKAIDNVELPLVYRGLSSGERRARAKEALTKVGLGEKMFHVPNQLSGGQQQRVAIARALAGVPPLLLADEPTGALDSKTSRDVMQLLKDLNAEGNTIVIITHDPNVAAQAKRVVRIQDGKLTEERNEAS